MKKIIEDDKIIIFLKKADISFDLKDEEKLKDYFQKLLLKLKNKIDLEDSSFYNIDVYSDEYYGYVLEITSNDIYYDYFNQIDIQVNILKNLPFLYEVDYEYLINLDATYYKKGSKLYIKLNKKIDDIIFEELIENSNIIYDDQVKKILKQSKKVDYEKTSSCPSGQT